MAVNVSVLVRALACAVVAGGVADAQTGDALPSWNEGTTKQAIVDFVRKSTMPGSPDFVPAGRRIATFDNDGTLWAEQPAYFQLLFALDRVKEKDIPGFGELFRWLSYKSIGTSTVQSRAAAVLSRGTYIFALPGSNGAVKDGWDGILAEQLDSRNRPCNFVELMPRLREV